MMMKRTISIILTLSIFLIPVSLYAEGSADYGVEIATKFGNGLKNVLSSPLEIPCTIHDDLKENHAAGAFTGLFKGIVFMLRRILVGVTEVGTFMIPMEETLPPVCAKRPEAGVHQ